MKIIKFARDNCGKLVGELKLSSKKKKRKKRKPGHGVAKKVEYINPADKEFYIWRGRKKKKIIFVTESPLVYSAV